MTDPSNLTGLALRAAVAVEIMGWVKHKDGVYGMDWYKPPEDNLVNTDEIGIKVEC